MKTVEFNKSVKSTSVALYECLCDLDCREDHSGRYVRAEIARRLLAAAKQLYQHACKSAYKAPAFMWEDILQAIRQAEEG